MSGFVKRKGHDPVHDSLVALRHATDPVKAYAIAEGIENHVAALRALNVEAVEMLAPLQWCRWDDGRRMGRCPSCGNFSWDGHAPDCKLDALLQKGTPPRPQG